MRQMILRLIAGAPEAQMFLGTAQMILKAISDPVIIRVCSRAIPHYLGPTSSALVNDSIPTPPHAIADETLRSRCTSGASTRSRFLWVRHGTDEFQHVSIW